MKQDGKRLTPAFVSQRALDLAPLLLGKLLCRQLEGGQIIKLPITETECYMGEEDTACHAHKGKTNRTAVLYEQGGLAYVYLCYGIHNLLNVVAGVEGSPEAVLIRGVAGYNGPGKLTKALAINRSLNWENLLTSQQLWLEDGDSPVGYNATKRVGIDYATPEYRDKLWRFVVE